MFALILDVVAFCYIYVAAVVGSSLFIFSVSMLFTLAVYVVIIDVQDTIM